MKNNGGGSIINIGSVHGLQSAANLVAYGVAKGGLLTLTKSFAGAYGRDHIRSNYIIPGWVITDTEVATHAKEGLPEAELRARGANLLFGRHQTPQDTAQVVLFLISDESSQITGMTFHIDAGMTTLVLKN
jgi:NAD(P)-dependent dehydrogenase (short-subunit alcohol dehydrogenase family)